MVGLSADVDKFTCKYTIKVWEKARDNRRKIYQVSLRRPTYGNVLAAYLFFLGSTAEVGSFARGFKTA